MNGPFAKYHNRLAQPGGLMLCLPVTILILLAPFVVYGQHGGHGGGGGHSGGHMGGSSFHGGGSSFHGGGISRGGLSSGGLSSGGLRIAPSPSFSPGRSFSPSIGAGSGIRTPSISGNVLGGNSLPSINGAANGAHSAFRLPTTGANALSGIPRTATGWNAASHAQLQHIHANLNNAINANASARSALAAATNAHSSAIANAARANTLASQGNAVRHNWNSNLNHHCMNNKNWWTGRHFIGFSGLGWWGGWGYSPWLNYYPWWYWWNRPTWNSCVVYLPGYGWNNGYYYDCGPGGNVVYQNGQVAVDGQVVGTDAEYAQSAAEFANVDSAELKAVPPADWMPLGTFSMAVQDGEVDPARVIQLAISKTGLISGTIHNRTSGNTYTVQGRVDKETQRVAFTLGDDKNFVLETGIYNLTQDQTPILCHIGLTQTQTYMLVRLPQPEHEPDATLPAPTVTPAEAPIAIPAEAFIPSPPDPRKR